LRQINEARVFALLKPLTKDHLLITHRMGCRTQPRCLLILVIKRKGSIMAKRKKQPSKVRKKKAPTVRSKARKLAKVARGKVTTRTVARAKPKRAQVKKAARPVTAAVETVSVEGLSVLAPGVTTVTEVEQAEAPQAS
jgi:hypothetical protein